MVNAPATPTITARRQIADGTMELKLRVDEPFEFQPGQYLELNLPDLPASPPYRVREFSLVSAPSDPELTIAFRASDSLYKQALLDPGYEGRLHLRGPHGIFTLDQRSTQPIVLIAGGIGVAPFVSMLRHGLPAAAVTLLRLESNPGRLAYGPEIRDFAKTKPNFSVVEQFGRLQDSHQLSTLVPSLSPDTQVFIAGPLGMTGHTRALVRELGVAPLSIKLEEFTGYPDLD